MKSLLLAAVLLNACLISVVAQDPKNPSSAPILIENSQSPDDLKNLTITDTNGDGVAMGLASIQDIKTGKSLGTFDWVGFGYHPDTKAFEVLWRPDSQAFAINYEISRGYVECKVFLLTPSGRCQEVLLPDFVAQTAKKYGLKTDSKGAERPEKWLSRNRLVINEYNRGWSFEDWQDRMRPYRVTLRIPARATSRRPTATIESIRPSS